MTIRWKENPELPPLLVKGRDKNWPAAPWLYCAPASPPPHIFAALYLGWFHRDELEASGGPDEIERAAKAAPVRLFVGPGGPRNGR